MDKIPCPKCGLVTASWSMGRKRCIVCAYVGPVPKAFQMLTCPECKAPAKSEQTLAGTEFECGTVLLTDKSTVISESCIMRRVRLAPAAPGTAAFVAENEAEHARQRAEYETARSEPASPSGDGSVPDFIAKTVPVDPANPPPEHYQNAFTGRWKHEPKIPPQPGILSTDAVEAFIMDQWGKDTANLDALIQRFRKWRKDLSETRTTQSVAAEAEAIVNGERAEAYGDPAKMLQKLCTLWGTILEVDLQPRQVALCMVALKLARELNQAKRDNVVDIIGYLLVMEKAGYVGR